MISFLFCFVLTILLKWPQLIEKDHRSCRLKIMEKLVCTSKMLRTEVEVRDRLSDLPDSLLLHVLSFLPAKEAVATSLLSKRWRPLWPSLPTLDFNRRDFKRLKFYHQFVDKMLKFVHLKSVKKFVLWLDCYGSHEFFRPWKISKWIDVVMRNKVEHLELHLWPTKGDYELPSSVFTANNIKVLKLSGARGQCWISAVMVGTISHVNLPLLEVLHLKDVRFPDVKSLGVLLSACALLKHLVLKDLYGNFNCTLDIGGLDHLVTADVPQYLLPSKVFSNATFLCLGMSVRQYGLSRSPDSTPKFHNLTYLELDYSCDDWDTILNYLHSCPKLQILSMFQFTCRKSLEPTVEVPTCVSSNLKEFHLGYYRGKNGEFDLARFIVENAKVLRIISITRHWCLRATWKSQNLKKISKCPISSKNCRLLLQ